MDLEKQPSLTADIDIAGPSVRTKRACNHCRWKRLKCTKRPGEERCLNCVAYSRNCEVSEKPARGKAKIAALKRYGPRTLLRKETSIAGDHGATISRPTVVTSHPATESPSESSYTVSPAQSCTKSIDSTRADVTRFCPFDSSRPAVSSAKLDTDIADTALEHSELSHRLNSFLTPMMVGLPEIPDDSRLSKHAGWLPSRETVDIFTTEFFRNVYPFYPIIDEASFRQQLDRFYLTQVAETRGWLLLMKTVVCVGARASRPGAHAKAYEEASRIESIISREVLMSLTTSMTVSSVESVQLLTLLVLYCIQIKNPSASNMYCKLATRLCLANRRRDRHMTWGAEAEALHNQLTWTLFILESNSAVVQILDHPVLKESQYILPTIETKSKHPVFCHRVALARLANQFVRIAIDPPIVTEYATKWERIYDDIVQWKDSLPAIYRLENILDKDCPTNQPVLLMHCEYDSLICRMITSLCASTTLAENQQQVEVYSALHIKDRLVLGTDSGRRIVQAINAMAASSQESPNGSCWLNSIQILTAFSYLYSHLRRNPHLTSTRADVELLFDASEHFRRHSTKTKVNASIQSLLLQIYRAFPSLPAQQEASTTTELPSKLSLDHIPIFGPQPMNHHTTHDALRSTSTDGYNGPSYTDVSDVAILQRSHSRPGLDQHQEPLAMPAYNMDSATAAAPMLDFGDQLAGASPDLAGLSFQSSPAFMESGWDQSLDPILTMKGDDKQNTQQCTDIDRQKLGLHILA